MITETLPTNPRRIYSIWHKMRQRCGNVACDRYESYGGRGITVCDEWQDYDAFEAWALSNNYAPHLTLDRRNNAKGYSPDNCRWATRTEQNRNRCNYVNADCVLKLRINRQQVAAIKEYAKRLGISVAAIVREDFAARLLQPNGKKVAA